MRILFLVNATASSVTARTKVVIQKALSADHDVTLAETSRRGHAQKLAQGAAAEGVELVVVLGGDGTLNEAANGLAGSSTALGVLPGGSTNVFARTIGMTNDPIEATGELLGGLARGAPRRIGLGSVNDRYFLFHVGMGFDAAVVQQVERRGALKRWAGHPLFVYSAFATWFRHYDRSRPRFTVSHESADDPVPGYLAMVFNSNPYTFLGKRPLNVAPDAGFDRGLVAVTFRSIDFFTILSLAASALGTGARLRHSRNIDYAPDLDEVLVTAEDPFPYQVDGDYLGNTTSLRFRYEPERLTVVFPG